MTLIAGHLFTGPHARCSCGRSLADISGVRRDQIGQGGWAHSGSLIEREYDEIRTAVDAIWRATTDIASGAGIGGMAAGTETGQDT